MIWTDKTIFFEIFEDKVENNSLKRSYYKESHIFNNLIYISSCLCALLIFKECIILRISLLLNEIDDKLALVTGVVTRGKVILFEIGVHWDAKKALKWFAFSLKFDVSLKLIKTGGIMRFSFHYREFSVETRMM